MQYILPACTRYQRSAYGQRSWFTTPGASYSRLTYNGLQSGRCMTSDIYIRIACFCARAGATRTCLNCLTAPEPGSRKNTRSMLGPDPVPCRSLVLLSPPGGAYAPCSHTRSKAHPTASAGRPSGESRIQASSKRCKRIRVRHLKARDAEQLDEIAVTWIGSMHMLADGFSTCIV